MNLKQIEDFHKRFPNETLKLYRKYGVYNKLPDVQTTIDLAAVMGEPFLMEMFNIYHAQESFLGGLINNLKDKKSNQEEQKDKGKLWDRFKKGFQDTLGMITQGKKTVDEVRTQSPPNDSISDPTGGSSGKIMGMHPGLFFGLVAAVVIVVVIVIINVTKK